MEENHFQHPVLGRQWQTDQPNVAKEISRISIFLQNGKREIFEHQKKIFFSPICEKMFQIKFAENQCGQIGRFFKVIGNKFSHTQIFSDFWLFCSSNHFYRPDFVSVSCLVYFGIIPA